jgi:hypothetical protein
VCEQKLRNVLLGCQGEEISLLNVPERSEGQELAGAPKETRRVNNAPYRCINTATALTTVAYKGGNNG